MRELHFNSFKHMIVLPRPGLVLIDTWKLVYKNTIPHGCQLSNQVFFSLKYYNSWTLPGRRLYEAVYTYSEVG